MNTPRKLKPGVYIHQNKKFAVVVSDDGKYHQGRVQIRQKKYQYVVWRDGKDVKNTYIGLLAQGGPDKRGLSGVKQCERHIACRALDGRIIKDMESVTD